jgi:hypothetical protein
MSLSVSANAHNIIIIIIIIIIISYHRSARYLQPCTSNKPCFYGI